MLSTFNSAHMTPECRSPYKMGGQVSIVNQSNNPNAPAALTVTGNANNLNVFQVNYGTFPWIKCIGSNGGTFPYLYLGDINGQGNGSVNIYTASGFSGAGLQFRNSGAISGGTTPIQIYSSSTQVASFICTGGFQHTNGTYPSMVFGASGGTNYMTISTAAGSPSTAILGFAAAINTHVPTNVWTWNELGNVVHTQQVNTSGSPTMFTITGGSHTTLTASTEATDINFNLARTVQFATGALTTQRAMVIQGPTYAFVGSSTITNATTLDINAAPTAGTNATITNKYFLTFGGAANPKLAVDSNGSLISVSLGSNVFAAGGGGNYAASSTSSSIYIGTAAGAAVTGINNTIVGHTAYRYSVAGMQNVAIGNNAMGAGNVSGQDNTAIGGYNCCSTLTSGNGNVVVGSYAAQSSNGGGIGLTTGSYNVIIGYSATGLNIGTSGAVALGCRSVADSNQFVCGSDQGTSASANAINDVYFGRGVTSTTASAYTIHGTGGSGTNNAGASLTVAGGIGTGTGVGGSVNLQIAMPGSTGSSANTLTTIFGISGTTSAVTLSQQINTSGSPTAFTVTAAAHTTLTASTEATDINFNLARTVQFAAGNLTTQRAMRIQAPTYAFASASTLTTAVTLDISGAPIAGTNATLTNAFALRVGGSSQFNGNIAINTVCFNALTANTPSGTTQTIDWTQSNAQTLTLSSASGNVTVSFTAPAGVCHVSLKIVQGATPRNITWPAAVKWDTGSGQPTWINDTSLTRFVGMFYDGSNYYASASNTFN